MTIFEIHEGVPDLFKLLEPRITNTLTKNSYAKLMQGSLKYLIRLMLSREALCRAFPRGSQQESYHRPQSDFRVQGVAAQRLGEYVHHWLAFCLLDRNGERT